MATVKIPAGHFAKSVRHQYSDIQEALIRESFQNSIDAGATEVIYNIFDDHFEVIDNGHGMSEERMIEAMLTMGGSVKEAGSIGGFGAAKEALLFMHQKYQLISRDTHVDGEVLEYHISKLDTPINGTILRAWFTDSLKSDSNLFRSKAISYLQKCETKAKVYVNGEAVTTELYRGNPISDLSFGKVYVKKIEEAKSHASVRINGVFMFSRYVGSSKNQIVVEITKPSVEVLTQNRDGLQHEQSTELQKLFNEVITDKESFGAKYNTTTTFTGADRTIDDMVELDREEREEVEAAIKEFGSLKLAIEAIPLIRDFSRRDALEKIQYNIKSDFYILVQLKKCDVIPEWIIPGKMGKARLRLAKLWKHCLKLVMKANSVHEKFCIGWVLNDQAVAVYSKKDDVNVFCLNPLSSWLDEISNPKHIFFTVLQTAAHEIAHLDYSYHDESFVRRSEDLFRNTVIAVDSWWNEYTAAAKETI